MHTTFFKRATCFAIACVLASNAFSQNTGKVLKFSENKTVIVEKATLAANATTSFLVEAKEFNLLRISVGGSYSDGSDAQGLTITLTKFGEKKELATPSPGESVEFQAQSDGIYVITVKNEGDMKASISARISLNE